jgi:hypothetical protein
MPTYVYRVYDENDEPTDEVFEVFQKMSDDALTHDEEGRPVRRVPQLGSGVMIDPSKPKTIGAIAEQNTERMIKENDPRIKKKEDERPWWRPDKDKPVDTKNWNDKEKLRYVIEGRKPNK